MKPHIVIVDDEADITENLALLLEDSYQVTSFNDSTKLIQNLENGQISRIDVVITDLRMPKLSGIEMVKKIYSLGFDFPFILFSGNLNKENTLEAMDLGAYRILEKPVRIEKLQQSIEHLLLEHQIEIVRKETRVLISQLRELYTSLRIVCHNYIPQDVMDRLVVEAPNGQVKKQLNFDDVMENLETRLHKLLNSEKSLERLRDSKNSTKED